MKGSEPAFVDYVSLDGTTKSHLQKVNIFLSIEYEPLSDTLHSYFCFDETLWKFSSLFLHLLLAHVFALVNFHKLEHLLTLENSSTSWKFVFIAQNARIYSSEALINYKYWKICDI